MAAFPSWVQYDWRDLQETPDPIVERTEMDRGRPKQRRTNSDARIEVAMTVHLDTPAQVADFETWFFDTVAAGQDYFDWTHPRTGAVVQARIVGGQLGPLSYLNRTLGKARRSFKIEYWRSAW